MKRFNMGLFAQFLISLAAIAPASGCSGSDGERGEDGTPGEKGTPGTPGLSGSAGPEGDPGSVGPEGDTGPEGKAGPQKSPRQLDERIGGWSDANRTAINKMLVQHGIASETYVASKRPVAVLDWDNTVVKNDIGDATFAWALQHDKILQPPNRDWTLTSSGLTVAAKTALNAACDAAANPGQPLPTSTNAACAAEIMNVYYNEKTVGGLGAWAPVRTSTISYPYAWVAQLFAGYRPHEVREFAQAAFDENDAAPIGAKQTVGGVSIPGYVRVYEQIQDLAGALDENGFDVWVLTASPQYFVDAISEKIGVPASHVIGIRTLVSAGKLTYHLEGCGTVADSQDTLITFDRGKRCWINKVIFDEPTATQLDVNADPSKRPVFVAGDSDTDIAMLKDATQLKLVIERNKTQVMCNALANYQGKWIHNPMFLEPKAPPTTAYPCSTAADNDGKVPIVDEAGNPMTDQMP